MVWEEHARALSIFGFTVAGVQFIILGFLIRLHFSDQAKIAAVSRSEGLLSHNQSEFQHMAPPSVLNADTGTEKDENGQATREENYEQARLRDEALLDTEEERLCEETRHRRRREEESRLAKTIIAGFAPNKR